MRLRDAHSEYLVAVTRTLLDLAVEDGLVGPRVDTGALARVIAGLGGDLARPEVIPTLRTSPKHAADAVLDIVLLGLSVQAPRRRSTEHRRTEPHRTER
jgi:hypothetical protein